MNQLYDTNIIDKEIKNADILAYKLKLALTRVINYKLKVASKKMWKKEKNDRKIKNKSYNNKMSKN